MIEANMSAVTVSCGALRVDPRPDNGFGRA
jgi:hypothetical protein